MHAGFLEEEIWGRHIKKFLIKGVTYFFYFLFNPQIHPIYFYCLFLDYPSFHCKTEFSLQYKKSLLSWSRHWSKVPIPHVCRGRYWSLTRSFVLGVPVYWNSYIPNGAWEPDGCNDSSFSLFLLSILTQLYLKLMCSWR